MLANYVRFLPEKENCGKVINEFCSEYNQRCLSCLAFSASHIKLSGALEQFLRFLREKKIAFFGFLLKKAQLNGTEELRISSGMRDVPT